MSKRKINYNNSFYFQYTKTIAAKRKRMALARNKKRIEQMIPKNYFENKNAFREI